MKVKVQLSTTNAYVIEKVNVFHVSSLDVPIFAKSKSFDRFLTLFHFKLSFSWLLWAALYRVALASLKERLYIISLP